MPDAGDRVLAADFQDSQDDYQSGTFTATNTSYDVTTASGTYVDAGVAFVAPTSGVVLFLYSAWLSNSSTTHTRVSPVIREGGTVGSGSVFQAASDSNCISVAGTNLIQCGTAYRRAGFTPGNTYNVRLEHNVSGGTGNFARRRIMVVPLPA